MSQVNKVVTEFFSDRLLESLRVTPSQFKRLLAAKKLGTREVAKRSGVTQRTVQRYRKKLSWN